MLSDTDGIVFFFLFEKRFRFFIDFSLVQPVFITYVAFFFSVVLIAIRQTNK